MFHGWNYNKRCKDCLASSWDEEKQAWWCTFASGDEFDCKRDGIICEEHIIDGDVEE